MKPGNEYELWGKIVKEKATAARVVAFLTTALIEAGQLFIGRSVDVDDLILNFAGV